jgi:hypothetical protein
MKVKHYKISTLKLMGMTMFNLLLLFLLVGFIFLTLHTLKGFFNNNMKLGYIGIGFLLLSIYAVYYFGTVFKLFFQYYSNNKNTEISIDFKNNRLTMENKDLDFSKTFTEENLQTIEFNISTKDSKNLTSEYDFIKLTTIDEKEYFITNLILNSSELLDIFPKVKRIIKLNSINYLR